MSVSQSATGRAKPARTSRSPAARTSICGWMRGEGGRPSASSAARSARRRRGRLPAPTKAARNRPSGRSARRIWISAPGKSLTVSSEPAETMRSKRGSAKGSRSSSPSDRVTARPRARSRSARPASVPEHERIGKVSSHQSEPLDQLVGHVPQQIVGRAGARAAPAPQGAVERSVAGGIGVHICRYSVRHPVRQRTIRPESDMARKPQSRISLRKVPGTPLAARPPHAQFHPSAWPCSTWPIKARPVC